jgi:hypothetical protein
VEGLRLTSAKNMTGSLSGRGHATVAVAAHAASSARLDGC